MNNLLKTAVMYLRCSSVNQIDGDSFERQANAVQRYADDNSITIIACFFEAFTGTSDDRPAFNDMLEFCHHSGANNILIERMDRWARKFSVGEYLTELCRSGGLNVINASNGTILTEDEPTPSAWLAIAFEQLLAEYEKRTIVYRTGQARARIRKETGKCEGRKGIRELNPQAVNRIWQLQQQLGNKPNAIADKLNLEQIPTIKGGPWRASTVHRELKRGPTC